MSESAADQQKDEGSAGYAAGLFFLFWAAVGWAGLFFNTQLRATLTQPGLDPGPALLPILTSTALSVGGVWFLLSGLVKKRSGIARLACLGIVLAGAFFVSALMTTVWISHAGFIVPAFVFGAVWLTVLSNPTARLRERLVFALIASGIIVAGIHLVFVTLLRVPLP